MDSTYSDQHLNDTYSRNSRSRAGSGVSTTEGLFQNLQLAETRSFETASYTSSRPSSSRGFPSPVYLSPNLSHSPGFLSTPTSQHQQPYPPLSSEAISDADWFETDHPRAQGAPLLRLEPASNQLGAPASPPLATIEPGTMRYGTRHPMCPRAPSPRVTDPRAAPLPFRTTQVSAWAADHPSPGQVCHPLVLSRSAKKKKKKKARSMLTNNAVLETGSGLMPPDLHYGSDASLTPPSGSRSVTASPPRSTLTPEQRELKRQRDQARHNSKLQARGRRTDSASSVYSPPVTLADLTTSASSMPVYTTAPSQISLLAEPSAPQYLPPFSPPLPDHNQANMFTNAYPPQPYMPDYGYPPTSTPSLPSHYGYALSRKPPPSSTRAYRMES